MRTKRAALLGLLICLFALGGAATQFSVQSAGIYGASQPTAAKSGTRTVVAHAFLDGMQLYLAESTDSGATFSDANRVLEDYFAYEPRPTVVLGSDGNTWVFYQSQGFAWVTSTQFDYNYAHLVETTQYPALYPSALEADGNFWLFYQKDNGKIYYQTANHTLYYPAVQWGDSALLASGTQPHAAKDAAGTTWLAFVGTDGQVYYKKHASGAWGENTLLGAGFVGNDPSAGFTDDGRTVIAYERGNTIYYAYSDDDGDTWSAEQTLVAGTQPFVLGATGTQATVYYAQNGALYWETA